MEKEIIETVLLEMLEETKRNNVLIEEQNKEIRMLKTAVSNFDKRLTEIKVYAPPLDIVPMTRIVTEGINNMQKIVAAQPKEVLHEKRFLFFPEWNQKEYYKIIFGRVLFWILWVIMARYCYFLCRDYLDRHF